MQDQQYQLSKAQNAALVSLVCSNFKEHETEEDTLRSLGELKELMRTLEIPVVGSFVQNKKKLEAGTVLGTGKLQEIAEEAKAQGADLLAFDFELTSTQVRNIKKITGLDVTDRNFVILEIFAHHARTREAKIQIEVSRLQYLLPRLSGMWTHFSRQKGGVGIRGGEGEQQIELDRRMIRKRIEFHKKDLVTIAKAREQQKKRRKNEAVVAALVGYTNAGKSSLMNKLCRADTLAEDKLFATLDSTFRMLNPDTRPPMVLVDTVGFLSNLPNALIQGFKTTLESALEADLLLHVVDISDPHYKKHIEVTEKVLGELGLGDKERLLIFNKKDLLKDSLVGSIAQRKNPNSFLISTLNSSEIDELRKHVVEVFLKDQDTYELFVPYENGEAHSLIESKTNVLNRESHENGLFYKVKTTQTIFEGRRLARYQTAP